MSFSSIEHKKWYFILNDPAGFSTTLNSGRRRHFDVKLQGAIVAHHVFHC